MKKIFLILIMAFTFSLSSNAQGLSETGLQGPKKQMATILYAGLAGAVLGLSTLSFYSNAQDHIENVAYGFGAGIIFGTGYVTWKAVTQPVEFYGTEAPVEADLDDAYTRGAADRRIAQRVIKPVQFRWTF